ncbi:MAG TPA: efflux RND transporter permease subunit [Thermoanaerobaculia bacterium]
MSPIDASIRYPVTVAVGVLIAMLGGFLALGQVPIQLTPEIARPLVNVDTIWPGASPEEVEKEIVEKQEEYLKSVEGLIEMRSESHDGAGQITLEFAAGTDLVGATVRVTNKLNEVPTYPQNAEKPIVTSGNRYERAAAWFQLRSLDPDVYAPHAATLVEDMVKPRLERVDGVARVDQFGGLERELHVTYDPDLLASVGITIAELTAALRAESQDVSAGDFGEGKRRYVVRTMGRYRSPEDVAQTVVRVRAGVPIRVGDVAEVTLAYQKPAALVRLSGEPALAMSVQRRIGANVLDVMEGLVAETERINREVLEPRGLKLEIGYQETTYINASIDRVLQNIYLGGFLAVVVLFLFLRSPSSILVVALSIPISVVTSFLTMYLMGRTINVISLAGMAFAVGMVVDNAIVVLENIYRHMQMGKNRRQAALDGTREVWGAVLASTITTVAVFLPIVFIQERAGQLFRDIALAIASAIVVSLAVAVTVIPSGAAMVLRVAATNREHHETLLGRLAARISALVDAINAGRVRRLAVIAAIVGLSVGLTWWLLPSAEYLPNGNQNFIFGVMLPPPGYNLEEIERVGRTVESRLEPIWGEPEAGTADLPGGGAKDFWYVGLHGMSFMGLSARDEARVGELVPVINQALASVPGAMGFASQQSLFSDDLAGTRSVRIDVTGPELPRILDVALEVFARVGQVLPGAPARPVPGLDLGNPEVRIYPDRVRAADAGFNAAEIGHTVNSLIDGVKVAEYFHEGREIDLVLKGSDDWTRHTQNVAELPLATPSGEVITLGDVAEVRERQGPIQINRIERQRVVSIETAVPDGIALEDAITRIENEIVEPLAAEGRLGGLYEIRLRGAADDLTKLRGALATNFLVVILLTFLLLAALFQSFLYPVVIMLTVPLATFGGVLGLRLVQLFDEGQQLDVLTMLGFVILVGTVINNSILIVYQALHYLRDGMTPHDAVRESVRVRVRPILMSTTTSSLGMLPLVVMPGAGSELYRGLGAVVVGGLLVSTVITLVLTPLVFTFVYELRTAAARRLGFAALPVADSAPAA